MTKHLDEPNFLKLFSDVDEGEIERDKPLLAHYTSIAVLIEILKNRVIWLSNPLFLNDYEELRFGMNEGRELFLFDEKIRDAMSMSLKDDALLDTLDYYFNDIFEQFEKNFALDTFVLSFCKHDRLDRDGKLSMWRGYGANGNGGCIVFDTAKITSVEDSPLIFGRVKYETRDNRKEKLREYALLLASELAKSKAPKDHLYLAAHYLFERYKLFGLLTKYNGFVEEDEYRLIYLPERDEEQILHQYIDIHVDERGLQPKLKLPTKPIAGVIPEDFTLESAIDHILLGPSQSSFLSQRVFEKKLDQLGYGELKSSLTASSIPFREIKLSK